MRASIEPVVRAGARWLFLLVFGSAMIVNVATLRFIGQWSDPPIPGDTQDYDNLALNLLHARGFGFFWSDPEWRSVYEAHNDADLYEGILLRSGEFVPTAYRPPFLPLAIAATYALSGRSFLVWGLVNCTLVAAAVALAARLALHLAGPLPALLTAVLGLVDSNLRNHAVASPYLAEGLSALLVMLFAWSLVRLVESRTPARAAAAGAALGLLVLARGIFVFWYPPALLFVAWAILRKRGAVSSIRSLAALATFLAVALAIPAPWWARNCAVLGRFMPLGTQGGVNLPLGYSDIALASGGVWRPEGAAAFWAPFEPGFAALPPLQAERERAIVGQRQAAEWIAAHPWKLPALAVSKLVDLWRNPFPFRFGLALAALALAALAHSFRRVPCLALWALLAFDSFGVMATYADGARFLVPVLPVLHILIGIGVWCVVVQVAAGLGAAGHSAAPPAAC